MFAQVALDAPLPPLDYRVASGQDVVLGDRVLVPLGSRKVVGVVTAMSRTSSLDPKRIKSIIRVLADAAPLSEEWLKLTQFAAHYYMRSWGQAAVSALPPFFRKAPGVRHAASLEKVRTVKPRAVTAVASPELNAEQQAALEVIRSAEGFATFLLFGVTGSGKTEVYLNAMSRVLEEDPEAQVLFLVPEINLTPQLERRVRERFSEETVVTLHSELSDLERARSWLAVHEGRSRVIVGTRMAVFASFRKLRLIIVDEEHDPSYKAGDGLRHSARDLAVKRAQLNGCPCVLGSATPSLETWNGAQRGAYRLLRLTKRAVQGASLPAFTVIDMRRRAGEVFALESREAVDAALARGEQVLVFINRRGYAPTVSCAMCGWVSRCLHCSTFTVFHKAEKRLVCHHCGASYRVPERCPSCGNPEINAVGTGTQRIEEAIVSLWPHARVLRLDRDSVKKKGETEAAFQRIHKGEVDIIVGTQMIAKGHDFKRVGLVVVLNVDAQIVNPDIRAEERLFSTVLQVAGRAGRGEIPGRVYVQSRFPDHPIFSELKAQSYERFAARALEDRRESCSPPFMFQAMLRAEAPTLDRALGFLHRARQAAPEDEGIALYDPVPMSVMRLMDSERGQLLVEAENRGGLHRFLEAWCARIVTEPGVNWSIEVDPVDL